MTRAVGTRPALVLGGAGFIGTNLAQALLRRGERVRVYDDLSRPGVRHNLEYLEREHGDRLEVCIADVRDRAALRDAVQDVGSVFHLAAQVAVTQSLEHPRHDLEVNLQGTFELLEALRALPEPPPLVFTSTNKVYGCLSDLRLVEESGRWSPADAAIAAQGIGEDRPLLFRSPYGCSKGAADQYVLDYAASFGLPATVFRMSCIYGPHQCGTEDQGWLAHFLIRAVEGQPITIYGDGKQVRDVLYIDDLVRAFLCAREHVDTVRGRAFNIGGGPESTLSLLELLDTIEHLRGRRPAVELQSWRTADQRYYVSDSSAFRAATGWRPRTSVREGVCRLHEWLCETRTSRTHAELASKSIAKGA